MDETWIERWNERYSKQEFAYGEEPNNYLKEQLEKFTVGTILFPAEGEGRNAVFAAKLGWTVSAFDISAQGKNKALRLAESNNVKIDYQVGELNSLHYADNHFDAIALIYAHFPAQLFSIEEIKSDFENFEILELEEKEIELKEGLFHNGIGMVIRFVGRKK